MPLAQFYGERLRRARLARMMTASSLAEQVGVSPGAISQYEKGGAEPRPRILDALCDCLSMPDIYFLRPEPERDGAPKLYRSQASAIKRARDGAEVRQDWFLDMFDTVADDVDFPVTSLPDINSPSDPLKLSEDAIERAATITRQELDVPTGPIDSMVDLLEQHGCKTTRFAFGAATLNAFSQFGQLSGPNVALNADETTAARGRFDAAHELGHLILHRNVPGKVAALPAVHKAMEVQAHRFASAFLFPAQAFADEVYSLSIDSLVDVKARWRVSIGMMIRRAFDLQLITQTRYSRAYRELSRRGYRLFEPLDDELEPERPSFLRDAIMLLVEDGGEAKESIRRRFGLSDADIEILSQLPRGYLSESWGTVVQLGQSEKTNATKTGQADVIRFPRK